MSEPLRKSGEVNGPLADGAVECSNCGHVGEPVGSGQCAECACFVSGNRAGVIVGHHGRQFWRAHDEARRELREEIIRDAGHEPTDHPPRTLVEAADSLSQAIIVRDAAYSRMAEAGGPVTVSGKARAVFDVWKAAVDRVERHAKMFGLERVEKYVDPIDDVRRAVAEANR